MNKNGEKISNKYLTVYQTIGDVATVSDDCEGDGTIANCRQYIIDTNTQTKILTDENLTYAMPLKNGMILGAIYTDHPDLGDTYADFPDMLEKYLPRYIELWPDEHYQFLVEIVKDYAARGVDIYLPTFDFLFLNKNGKVFKEKYQRVQQLPDGTIIAANNCPYGSQSDEGCSWYQITPAKILKITNLTKFFQDTYAERTAHDWNWQTDGNGIKENSRATSCSSSFIVGLGGGCTYVHYFTDASGQRLNNKEYTDYTLFNRGIAEVRNGPNNYIIDFKGNRFCSYLKS